LPSPPTSTLFPYTTLFRSEGAARDDTQFQAGSGNPRQRRLGVMAERGIGELVLFRERDPSLQTLQARARAAQLRRGALRMNDARSEEHTSELQSRSDLVCR